MWGEVLGDVLGVDDPDVRAGKARPDGPRDPWAEPVVAAEDMADADEASRLPEESGQPGRGAPGLEIVEGIFRSVGHSQFWSSPEAILIP
jgi:hypothetical protein